jgi:4-hydroxybenzoate polyprenyltransferase
MAANAIELIRNAREEGRRVVLVSAAEQRQVNAVARHLGLFDEAYGTGTLEGTNLGGHDKARFLIERFGDKGFDYIGDSRTDLPVWAAARRAITIRAPAGLRSAAERVCAETQHLDPPAGLRDAAHYLRALRPHQWLKNLLVFVPVLAAHEPAAFGPAIAAFIAFSLTASSVYLINDLLDLPADRAHPRKRYRPLAAGLIPVSHAVGMALALVVLAGLLGALALPLLFVGVLACYYAITFAYSLFLKRKAIIDVWTLAALYTLRIMAGSAATGLPLSFWMLGFSMFLFLSLATVKRQAEITDQLKNGQSGRNGRAYRLEDLPILCGIALSAGYAAVVVLALYINSPEVLQLYSSPTLLWFICPLLLYWISRVVMVTHRGGMTDDPIIFAVGDTASLGVLALSALSVVAAATL